MKQGDILTHPDGHTRKILGICGEAYFLSEENSHETANYTKPYNVFPFYTIHDLTMLGYIIPKEQWNPEEDEKYYYLDSSMGKSIQVTMWQDNDLSDHNRYNAGNCFKTEAEAQIAANKIKDLLKGL